jgi:hypothetical protein
LKEARIEKRKLSESSSKLPWDKSLEISFSMGALAKT